MWSKTRGESATWGHSYNVTIQGYTKLQITHWLNGNLSLKKVYTEVLLNQWCDHLIRGDLHTIIIYSVQRRMLLTSKPAVGLSLCIERCVCVCVCVCVFVCVWREMNNYSKYSCHILCTVVLMTLLCTEQMLLTHFLSHEVPGCWQDVCPSHTLSLQFVYCITIVKWGIQYSLHPRVC